MQRARLILLLGVLLVVGSYVPLSPGWLAAPPVRAATNLLLNPGFELDANANGKPDTWSSNSFFMRSDAVVHGGAFAGRWESTRNNAPSSQQTVNVTAGTTYLASAWANAPTTSDAFTFRLRIQWRHDSTLVQTTEIGRLDGDTAGAWQELRGSFIAPAGATTARIQMITGSLNATIYVDDFAFMADETEPPPPPVGPPDTTITSGPSGSVASSSASFTFTASGPALFECDLDAAGFVACTSPASYAGLTVGSHTFQVRAANGEGTDPSPASRTWSVEAAPGQVSAAIETVPVPHPADGADDPAIWIHPLDPSLSLVIGTDKQDGGGLFVYDLAGAELQQHLVGGVNNVDLREGFPLGTDLVSLVAGTARFPKTLVFARVDAETRTLVDVRGAPVAHRGAGICMYHSSVSGVFYAFVTNSSGIVQQFALFDDGTGRVSATIARTFDVGDTTEGCVVDDAAGALYISEERVGIWRYDAEPTSPLDRTLVDAVGAGSLVADVEGLALASGPSGARYLVASSQGNDSYSIYEREPPYLHVGTFGIAPSASIDGVSGTDGIELTSTPLGDAFPGGLFVAHDGENERRLGVHQNFKLVRWDEILESIGIAAGSSSAVTAQEPR